MGRTYRQKDKRFKKQLREDRRVRRTKRRINEEDLGDFESKRKDKDRTRKDQLGSYLFIN